MFGHLFERTHRIGKQLRTYEYENLPRFLPLPSAGAGG